jgi:hypothetical protein
MSQKLGLLVCVAGFLSSVQAFAQCEFVSFEEAQLVLGEDITDFSGDDAETQCYFLSNSTNASFIVQISDRAYFETVTLQEPFDAADIGEEGRARLEDNGGASVQFVQGDVSATMVVRPITESGADYSTLLHDLAVRVAARQ